MSTAARGRLSAAEYLAFERAAADRHELADGQLLAMAGGTVRQALPRWKNTCSSRKTNRASNDFGGKATSAGS